MARKIHNPYAEGSLQKIYDWYIAPLLKYKPADMPYAEWMKVIFNYATRDIIRYRVKRRFKLPGLFRLAAAAPVQGLGHRMLAKGDYILVRFDSTQPDAIDVEALVGQGQKDSTFLLSEAQFDSIRTYLEEAEENENIGKCGCGDDVRRKRL